MSFSEKQLRALERNIPAQRVRTRVNNGKELSYIEGWYAIAAANRIFGFDGWDRETIEAKCVLAREARGTFLAVYTTKVRIAVRLGDRTVIREGHGSGEGRGAHPGEAHDLGLKTAETDATKRALATFGKAFGLALYANDRRRRVKSRAVEFMRPYQPANGNAVGMPEAEISDRDMGEGDPSPVGPTGPLEIPLRGAPGRAHLLRSEDSPDADAKPPLERVANGSGSRTNGLLHAPFRTTIDKSALTLAEPRRVRDKDHLRFVATQPCLLCESGPADAHHLRFAQPRALGRKVGDEFTVPLCRRHHREVHHGGDEASWWHDMGIDPIEMAAELWHETRTRRAGESPQEPTPDNPLL